MSVIEKQWKFILSSIVLVLVIGLGIAIKTNSNESREKTEQERFFFIEKKYSDYKTKKSQLAQKSLEASVSTADKRSQKSKKGDKGVELNKFSSEDQKKIEVELDLALTDIKKSFEGFLSGSSTSKAMQMAAMLYSEILLDEKNNDLAQATLAKVQNNDTGLINSLVQQQLGNILAAQDKCTDAIAIWQKIINRKEASFLHDEVKIQQALCYQKTNDLKKAEEILTNVANQKSDGAVDRSESNSAKEAAKYLRLIQFKKISGT